MKIQTINSSMCASNCQPIKNQNFSQNLAPNMKINDTKDCDVFTSSDPYTQEQKFDLACRLAAYYQNQYEKLQQQTGCLA